ncbi:MAG: alkaline phosphatase D family protein [Sphingobacteriales bacterium]|nr:MAG: alkaline phosphatase D family protein [Sphingobacteriales bacterium]
MRLIFGKCFIILTVFLLSSEVSKAQIVFDETLAPFYHGVASGDPLDDRVIIWTRISNVTESTLVHWQIATDTSFNSIVNCGSVLTDDSKDFTVKVDVDRLEPNTYYYYRFFGLGKFSLTGRTKTLPVGDVNNARLAIVSCARLTDGIYNVYGRIAERNDIDAVLHLGDYIYEYGNTSNYPTGGINPHDPPYELITLSDYRTRYAQYHTEINLRKMRQQHPIIVIWDDHETANNSWYGGAENHDSSSEGDWFVRKAAGVQASFEWQPIRESIDNPGVIFRKFSFGNLADLIMLDTRLEGRDEQPSITGNLNSSTRKMVSTTQLNWLTNALSNEGTQWKIMAQQVMVAPLVVFGLVLNTDQWDGYQYQRSHILNHVINNSIPNLVVLTGDIHSSWANDLPRSGYNASTGANSYGVEFVVSGASSAGIPFSVGETLIRLLNPHVKWVDVDRHGYNILDITTSRTQCEWYFVPTITSPNTGQTLEKTYYTNSGERHLRLGSGSSESNIPTAVQAPLNPKTVVSAVIKVALQGAFDPLTGLMRTDLQSNFLIPPNQPFTNITPFHSGNELLNIMPPEAVDWVVVELRDPNTYEIVDSVAAILMNDGFISGANWGGCPAPLLFPKASPGNYYIVVKARNHLGVMSSTTVNLPSQTFFDFTQSNEQSFGIGQQVEIATNLFAIYSGDCNNDGVINVHDFNIYNNATDTGNGYLQGDCNLDGVINVDDFELWKSNAKQIGIFWIR